MCAQLPFQNVPESLSLGEPEPPDQHLLGVGHEPLHRQCLAQVTPLPPEDLELCEAFLCDRERLEETPLVQGRQVRDDTRLPAPSDELGAGVASEEDHGHRLAADDCPGRVDAVEPGEAGLHEDEVRAELLGRRDRLPPVSRQSEHVMTQPLQLCLQAIRHRGSVLDDENPERFSVLVGERHRWRQ